MAIASSAVKLGWGDATETVQTKLVQILPCEKPVKTWLDEAVAEGNDFAILHSNIGDSVGNFDAVLSVEPKDESQILSFSRKRRLTKD